MFRPTELQLDLLQSIWQRGEATIAEVHIDLSENRDLAPTTTATLLRRLHQRGLVSRRKEGRQHVYRAEVSPEDVRAALVNEVESASGQLYRGGMSGLLAHFLSASDLGREDLRELRNLIDAREAELEAKGQ